MSRKYKFQDQEGLYFITYSVVHWIDVLIRIEYREVLLDSWRYCIREKGLEVYGWCIMPSHVHMIVGTSGSPLQDIVRDMKRHTSSQLRKAINEHSQESRKEWMLHMMETAGAINHLNNDFQFWQQHNHPIELNSNHLMQQKLDYLHRNPVTAGFVSEPEHWLYSSALDYSGGKGLLSGLKLIE